MFICLFIIFNLNTTCSLISSLFYLESNNILQENNSTKFTFYSIQINSIFLRLKKASFFYLESHNIFLENISTKIIFYSVQKTSIFCWKNNSTDLYIFLDRIQEHFARTFFQQNHLFFIQKTSIFRWKNNSSYFYLEF